MIQTSLRGVSCLVATAAFMLICAEASAQKDWEKDGGIPNAEIEIVKDRKISLPPADRNFEKIPPRPVEIVKHNIVYDYRNLKFNSSDYSPLIRPLKLKQEEISRIYGNYVSGGFGNYSSPYLEGYFTSKRDKNKFYGVHLYHHSFGSGPVDGNNSASATTEAKVFGKSITDLVTASAFLNYDNRSTYFYGYPPGSEPLLRLTNHQVYNTISLGGSLENTKPGDLTYNVAAGYSHLSDHYKTTEGELALNGKSNYKLSDNSRIILDADYFMIGRKDSSVTHTTRNLFKLRPAYLFTPMPELRFTAGLNIAADNDAGSKLHVFPNIRAEYTASETITAYAALTGDVDKVTLHSLSAENLWVKSNIDIRNTVRTGELLAGLKGKLSGKVAFSTGLSFATLQHLYSFRNSQANRAKFDVIYNNTTRTNVFGELGFNPGEKVKMSVRGDVYAYTTDEVYHKPKYRLAFNSSYNLFDKLWFNVDLIGQGGMKTYDFEKSTVVKIPGALDLNAKADYFFSRRVSAFIKVNNLLSNNYSLYLNYPVRGLQVMGGVTCTF